MSERDLTPAQEESVRALLASARHTDPAPPAVVARLDDALAELVARRREERAPVVTLASRRRRLAASALLAAAAVVVLGVGVTQVLPGLEGGSADSSGSSAESNSESFDEAGAGRELSAGEAASPESSAAGASRPKTGAQDRLAPSDPVESSALTSTAALRPQVRALRSTPTDLLVASEATCPVADAGSATQLAITYDETPGVAVYREPVAGRQRVDVYLCGAPSPLKSVQIPAP